MNQLKIYSKSLFDRIDYFDSIISANDLNLDLINGIEQLQPFYEQTIKQIHLHDQREMSEAISHLISSVPLTSVSHGLQLFCLPVAQRLNVIVESMTDKNDKAKVIELNCKISIYFSDN